MLERTCRRARFLPRLSESGGTVSVVDDVLEGPATAFAGVAVVVEPGLVPEGFVGPVLPGLLLKYCEPLFGYACSYVAVS